MRVLIIEDEELAAERLETMLAEVEPGCSVVAKIGSVNKAVSWLQQNNIDLIFLDIQLSDGLSFSIFERVKIDTPIILTTAYVEYAIKAFKLNSISYLLKPIQKRDLAESLQKYKSMRSAFIVDFEKLMSIYAHKNSEYKSKFLIRIGDMYKKIETSEIAYFYATEKIVFIKTFEKRAMSIEDSLDALEKILDPAKFFRINRGYIINISAIENMEAWSRSRIKLELNPQPNNDMDTIVSIGRTADFKRWMNK